ncbi:MAG: hypothetical protein WD749_11145 [Phycisphaerales bacterium]
MRAVRSSLPYRYQVRACLRCGYGGPEVQPDQPEPAFVCPCCGEDLYSRPPRSYAELEGLDEAGAWSGWGFPSRLEGGVGGAVRRFFRAIARTVFLQRQ